MHLAIAGLWQRARSAPRSSPLPECCWTPAPRCCRLAEFRSSPAAKGLACSCFLQDASSKDLACSCFCWTPAPKTWTAAVLAGRQLRRPGLQLFLLDASSEDLDCSCFCWTPVPRPGVQLFLLDASAPEAAKQEFSAGPYLNEVCSKVWWLCIWRPYHCGDGSGGIRIVLPGAPLSTAPGGRKRTRLSPPPPSGVPPSAR
jgi:hypothetical protein